MSDNIVHIAPDVDNGASAKSDRGGVQSIRRAFDILQAIADLGGIASLSDVATRTGLPLTTIHRLTNTLVDIGYLRRQSSRRYGLGPRLVPLGERASQQLGAWTVPYLKAVVDQTGESVNLAILEGDEVLYVAHIPGLQSMRMFTEVGRRAPVHCTAVGKAILASMAPDRAREIVTRTGMACKTPNTLTDLDAFDTELAEVRRRGYAVDDEEQEIGVRCVAVPLKGWGNRAALSVSGPSPRMTKQMIRKAAPILREAAAAVTAELT